QRAYGLRAHFKELLVRHRHDDRIVGARARRLDGRDAVFVHGLGRIDPGVVDVYIDIVFAQLAHNVDHTRVAQVGAVFLEGQAHDQYPGALHLDAALGHGLDQLRHDIAAHAVVQAAAG